MISNQDEREVTENENQLTMPPGLQNGTPVCADCPPSHLCEIMISGVKIYDEPGHITWNT